ncbi:MAG: ribonuclease R [Pseudomonadota bacterium]
MDSLPDRETLLAWIRENPGQSGKREIARAFGIKGPDRIELKRMLRDLQETGEVERHRRQVRERGALPNVCVLIVTGPDDDGDLFARPLKSNPDAPQPRILLKPRKKDPAFAAGDRLLARMQRVAGDDVDYEATPIKRIAADGQRMIGIYRAGNGGGRLEPVERKAAKEWVIPRGEDGGARDGDLAEAEEIEGRRFGLPHGRIIAHYGNLDEPGAVSRVALLKHQIPHEFPADVETEARSATGIDALGDREDLRDLPLVTIDPPDARDHDDAVCALKDEDPANPDGFVVWVAIADVAHYVRAGSALDREARERGNSTYFPDLVVPMLPETLSADLCSLRQDVERPCLAVRMVLNAEGDKLEHRFTRGLMRSRQDLTYAMVQAVADGDDVADLASGLKDHIRTLFDAYRAADRARTRRQPLDLDLPERQIVLGEDGTVASINFRDRLDAHRLIEEFMILANVCAAETLETKRTPLLYRVHEEPNPDKLDALREVAEAMGLSLAKGQVLQPRQLNGLLESAKGRTDADVIAMSVLRAQTQAYYANQNFGHFGLNLKRYAHFTSPIRRYADLVVHRALISALKLGGDGLSGPETDRLPETAEHISRTERRSMEAERETVDRYVSAFLADRTGAEFSGRVSGISRAGVFVRLDETGADGLIPISTLGNDYFRYDRDSHLLRGERSGLEFRAGMTIRVRLIEATPISGGLIFELLQVDGHQGSGRRSGGARMKGSPRKVARARLKKARAAKKAKRTR